MSQLKKANVFKALHEKGNPLVLYNIWDAGGAKALADAGANAIATGSWSVAAAQGFEDGELIPLDLVLQVVERIAESVDLPVSVDFEGGYATEPEGVLSNVRKIIKAGAIGINFEDQVVGGEGLYPALVQVKRIKAVREAAELEDVPLFINARTDLFLKSDPIDHEKLVAEAIEREKSYVAAGADGFFIPGLTNLPLIKQIVEVASVPVNVMMKKDMASIADLGDAGVSRVSYGPGSYFNSVSDFTERYKALRQQ